MAGDVPLLRTNISMLIGALFKTKPYL